MSKRDAGSPLVVGHSPAAGETDNDQLAFIGLIRRRDGAIVVRRYGRLRRRDGLGRMVSEIQLQSASHIRKNRCAYWVGWMNERL